MVWRFLKHYGVGKANDLVNEFAQTVVRFDPAGASEAQIGAMEAELQRLGQRLAEAEAEVKREHRETEALSSAYEENMAAARIIEARTKELADGDERHQAELSLGKVVGELERLKPELEREQKEDQEVEAWRAELRQAFEELTRKIRDARGQLQSARRELDVARIRKQRAETTQAGSIGTVGAALSSLSVALESMNRETAKVRSETEVIKARADILRGPRIDEDPVIAKALAEVRGTGSSGGSLSDRLAALDAPKSGGTPTIRAA